MRHLRPTCYSKGFICRTFYLFIYVQWLLSLMRLLQHWWSHKNSQDNTTPTAAQISLIFFPGLFQMLLEFNNVLDKKCMKVAIRKIWDLLTKLNISQCGDKSSMFNMTRGFKGSQLGVFFHRPWCTVTLSLIFAICWKYFHLRVKESFKLIVSWKRGMLLLFLKAFSCNTNLWITLGDFTITTQNLEGECVLKWKSIKHKWIVVCVVNNHNYMSHMCKRIFKFKF